MGPCCCSGSCPIMIMMLLCLCLDAYACNPFGSQVGIAFVEAAPVAHRHVKCYSDLECQTGQICLPNGFCGACIQCKTLLRHGGCVLLSEQCGPCLPGHHDDGYSCLAVNNVTASNKREHGSGTFSPEETEGSLSVFWIIIPVVGIGLVVVVIWQGCSNGIKGHRRADGSSPVSGDDEDPPPPQQQEPSAPLLPLEYEQQPSSFELKDAKRKGLHQFAHPRILNILGENLSFPPRSREVNYLETAIPIDVANPGIAAGNWEIGEPQMEEIGVQMDVGAPAEEAGNDDPEAIDQIPNGEIPPQEEIDDNLERVEAQGDNISPEIEMEIEPMSEENQQNEPSSLPPLVAPSAQIEIPVDCGQGPVPDIDQVGEVHPMEEQPGQEEPDWMGGIALHVQIDFQFLAGIARPRPNPDNSASSSSSSNALRQRNPSAPFDPNESMMDLSLLTSTSSPNRSQLSLNYTDSGTESTLEDLFPAASPIVPDAAHAVVPETVDEESSFYDDEAYEEGQAED